MKLTELMPSIYKLIPYEYEKIKNDEYEMVMENLLAPVETSLQPRIRQISGIPGSGKSELCKRQHDESFLFLSFDQIMNKLGGYHKDADDMGLVHAFENWEIPARVVGYELLRRAIGKKVNIILEHSGVNDAHVEMFKNIKKIGYHTEVNFTKCDIELAHSRVVDREKIIKRHTPRKLIEERAAALDKYMAIYNDIADMVRVFDTCGLEPVEIKHGSNDNGCAWKIMNEMKGR